MTILAIDPGHDCGWAFGDHRVLVACGLGDDWRHYAGALQRAVIEYPVVHQRTPNANDIVRLAFEAGRVSERIESLWGIAAELVLPARWKGNVSKEIHQPRIRSALLPQELSILESAISALPKRTNSREASTAHNVVDAVGLLLWAFDRRT